MRVVIVGGSFAGIHTAMALRKHCPDSEIILIEKQAKIGFIPSGINLLLKKEITEEKQLYWMTKEKMEAFYNVDVRINTEVASLGTTTNTLILQNGGQLTFDHLVIATGSNQQFKTISTESELIRSVRDAHLKEPLEEKIAQAQKVAIVGAGQVGIELVEGLVGQNKQIHLYESRKNLLFRYFDPEMVAPLREELEKRRIPVFLNEQVQSLVESESVTVTTDQRKERYDLVLLANHTRPDNRLWQEKLKLNDDGTIWVDDYLQTSAKNIYAIGDTIQVNFRPTEEKMYVSLVNNAIRTAHVVSRTISGKPTKDPGTYRPVGNHWFGYFLGSVGITEEESIFYPQQITKEYLTTQVSATDHQPVKIKIIQNEQQQLVGAQLQSKGNIFHLLDQFTLAIEESWTLEQLEEHELFFQPEYRMPIPFTKVVEDTHED